MSIKIIGTGSYIPSQIIPNENFLNHNFKNADGSSIDNDNKTIIEKFEAITGIRERRYASSDLNASDIGFLAAQKAIEDAKIDKESLDYIIVAHNFGDVKSNHNQSDLLPSLSSRIKHLLKIRNPKCVAYDILFGCPGWVEGVIQANAFIKAGLAKNCLVIGTETLSRVVDANDRDAMIFSDGAGATIISKTDEDGGILNHETVTFSYDEVYYLGFGESYEKNNDATRYIKMEGRKIYEFALTEVPKAMKACLDGSGEDIKNVKKIFIHQANEKMDEAILKRFYRLFKTPAPDHVMPMSIQKLGNSSVATIPTLFDLVKQNQLENHTLKKGDIYIFASVGAGMHINAIVYKY